MYVFKWEISHLALLFSKSISQSNIHLLYPGTQCINFTSSTSIEGHFSPTKLIKSSNFLISDNFVRAIWPPYEINSKIWLSIWSIRFQNQQKLNYWKVRNFSQLAWNFYIWNRFVNVSIGIWKDHWYLMLAISIDHAYLPNIPWNQ